ncbi:bifunctional 5,10-methylenetetrahydrofolate dehydrogenase/5,10-methenyltetrahydrofolate cyclohydrolase [Acetivibrio ethanolgignens]|uniref:Bifunctional protein FolD n=1 Tax=Acetivibrio ethanolgignens TaxID=290052 RepID=A0A0V8Q9Z4_9FIRM|nr:bifunctional 5,10-methylenetetrahydrofolate dehydrogenase/5,10-methenyltetrahydrofolate cyclohydrolase [Acetivibrio ethanolgignens]KSV57400.1 hypothetical protein ASU35_16350 [Acetivibrio ethanolgignens]
MVINCKEMAQEIKANVTKEIKENNLFPTLLIIIVGNNKASETYVKGKVKDCKEVGIGSYVKVLDESTTEEELIEILKSKQAQKYSGIIVQFPLPKHIREDKIIEAINPMQDVDGFRNDSKFTPCTPAGIMEVLKRKCDLRGKNALIINRSNIVGRPLINLLLDEDATVTIAHSKTEMLEKHISMADIIITAVGKPNFIKRHMLHNNQIVIDVSINRNNEGKLCGDLSYVDLESSGTSYPYYKNIMYTPVPGGIGLTTRAMLMKNVLEAEKGKIKN